MAGFRESVLSMCWLSPILTGLFFWVVGLTTFMAPHTSVLSPSPSPGATEDDCTADKLKSTVLMSLRWMAVLAISEMVVLFYVRWFVETEAGDETKAASIEDEPRKRAREELREAEDKVQTALKVFQREPTDDNWDKYFKTVSIRDKFAKKVEGSDVNLKVGLARLPTFWRRWVRFAYSLVILLSFAMGYYSAKAFYYSLRLQIGCVDEAREIAPFAVVGTLSFLVHGHALLVATTRD